MVKSESERELDKEVDTFFSFSHFTIKKGKGEKRETGERVTLSSCLSF